MKIDREENFLRIDDVDAIFRWGSMKWTTGGPPAIHGRESASRPLIGFGDLNDNMIKGLTILLKMS